MSFIKVRSLYNILGLLDISNLGNQPQLGFFILFKFSEVVSSPGFSLGMTFICLIICTCFGASFKAEEKSNHLLLGLDSRAHAIGLGPS